MTPGEAYIFTSFDSRTDGRARFVPHAGRPAPDLPSEGAVHLSPA